MQGIYLLLVARKEGGIVAAVSDEAKAEGIQVGDKVAYSVLQTYAQYSAVPAAKLLPVPDGVGLDIATACVVQGLTAHYLTTSAHAGLIQPGEWCLIHGVGGGTCQWAAQMAKIRGYKVIGTCAKGKADIAKSLGCDELIILDEVPGRSYEDYESIDVVAKVMEITNGRGAKCVIDGIDKSAYVTRPKLLDYTTNRAELIERANDIFTWLQDGKLNVSIDTTFPLGQAAQGHIYLEAGKSKGKVLLTIT